MPQGYQHVTRDIRSQIYVLKARGVSVREIAQAVGKSTSTISREVRRNKGQRGYRYEQAHQKAMQRRQQVSRRPKKLTPELKQQIEEKLMEGWSPEQIAGRFKLEGKSISHETIYRHVWDEKRRGGTLYKHLRHAGKRYNKRASGKSGRGCIPNRKDITQRPWIVETKSRLGDWEGDTIIGARHKGVLLTYVDRCSKFTLIQKVEQKTAELVRQATVEKMARLPHPIRTITFDNGKEFADHQQIAKALKADCYFATPYHSWERGLNEHTNGLIRQYFPKSTNLSQLSHEQVRAIQNRLNNRPRKVLNYKTPSEVFFNRFVSLLPVALRC